MTTTSKEGLTNTNIDDLNVDSGDYSEQATEEEGNEEGENAGGDASGRKSTNACSPIPFEGAPYIPLQSPEK